MRQPKALSYRPSNAEHGVETSSFSTRHSHYTIAWICALHLEMAAALAMLDETHPSLPNYENDTNTYTLGRINEHNIVIACLPDAQYGTNNAANVLTNLTRTFPSIRLGLMVGIGGGAPSRADIRLGDIVVGTRVMQYDLGKITSDGQIQRTAIPRIPEPSLGTAVSKLRSHHDLQPSRVPSILQERLGGHPEYGRPSSQDRLFRTTYEHSSQLNNCDKCDHSELMLRSTRISDAPTIHYGAIASGNQVMKNGMARDTIARQLDVICFEMEAAGLMDILPCLPVRGICDYADSHKSKEWQRYAAAVAAAYAREFLSEALPLTQARREASRAHNIHRKPSRDLRQRLLKSFKFDQIDARKSNIERAHAKTCQWLLDHPDFKAWLDPERVAQHHGVLWLSGKPGAGKSTIMKFAYGSVKSRARGPEVITASFFFNARGERLERSISGMYRSLLLQLLEGFPDLQAVLDNPELLPEGQNRCPSLEVLKDLFRGAVSQLGQRSFTCFVDALDECDEQQVMDMVQYFEDLTEYSATSGIRLRVCFSSRHFPYIDIRRGIRLILEDQDGHKGDLASYVMSHLRIRDAILVENLQHQLLEKAAGVFLWIVLVVDILNREDRRGRLALRKRLAEIPSGLSDLFKDILQRENEKDVEELQLCILLILYAKRPLNPEEYYHALWSGLFLKDLADSEIPDVTAPDSRDIITRSVISSSKGIAEITKSEQPTVQFIHESVRDFFIKEKGLHELWPDLGFDWESLSHERLKQCCSTYMNRPPVRTNVSVVWPGNRFSGRKEVLSTPYPFLEYAYQHVLYHAEMAAGVVSQDDFLSRFPVRDWINISNFFGSYKGWYHEWDTNLLYLLAENGFSELIRTRLRKDSHTEILGGQDRYPLFAALANGREDAAAALLISPPTSRNRVHITDGLRSYGQLTDYVDRTPLSWAAQGGRTMIARLLIQKGVPVDEVDRGGLRPLERASIEGHEAVARLLIDNGAGVDEPSDERGETPLFKASSNGHEGVARVLVENRAKINGDDKEGRTSLWVASSKGHRAVVELLLKNGADANWSDLGGRTPLWIASDRGNTAVVRLLLKNRAEVDGSDPYGCTPLWIASDRGHKTVVTCLIEWGAKVDARNRFGRTPLFRASYRGQDEIVRALINGGADVNACNRLGKTALSVALYHGHEAVASLLKEKGAVEGRGTG